MSNAIRVRQMLRRLAAVEPLEVPAGEPGVVVQAESGATRSVVPVLSAYLDLRPQAQRERPARMAGRAILKERVRQIEQTFWPRGVALDAIRTDVVRIEAYLDTQLSPAAQGVAIFASTPHALFEALAADIPFDNQISARAQPDLFQLARLLDDQETAVVAVTDTHAARLFVLHLGGLREGREEAHAHSALLHHVRLVALGRRVQAWRLDPEDGAGLAIKRLCIVHDLGTRRGVERIRQMRPHASARLDEHLVPVLEQQWLHAGRERHAGFTPLHLAWNPNPHQLPASSPTVHHSSCLISGRTHQQDGHMGTCHYIPGDAAVQPAS
jgi:hypothetical protein